MSILFIDNTNAATGKDEYSIIFSLLFIMNRSELSWDCHVTKRGRDLVMISGVITDGHIVDSPMVKKWVSYILVHNVTSIEKHSF